MVFDEDNNEFKGNEYFFHFFSFFSIKTLKFRIDLKVFCQKTAEKPSLNIKSPLEFELNLTCSTENLENILKKIRSLITSISSESIEDDTQEANLAKKTIFDVFLMDFEENNDIQTKIQTEIVKIVKILGFSLKKLRINTQKINVQDFDFFEDRRPLKTYTIQEIPNNHYFSNRNRILFEKFNEYRIFLWVSDFMPYFINVLFFEIL